MKGGRGGRLNRSGGGTSSFPIIDGDKRDDTEGRRPDEVPDIVSVLC